MSQPTPPPGPPVPGPDGDHGRRSVRIAMISLVVSSVLTVIGFVVTATTSDRGGGTNGGTTSGSTTTTGGTDGGTDGGSAGGDTEGTDSGGTAGATAGGTDTSGTDSGGGDDSGSGSGGSEGDDGLTTAERDLRDSLNDSQWTRESCVSEIAPGSDAAVTCTVTTESVTMGQVTTKASVAVYPSRSKQQEVYLAYGGTLQEGDCSQMWNVRGSWYESDSGDPTGDMSCYTPNGTQYVIVCTYYDRNAVFQVMGGDPRTLIAWWKGLEPVFVD
ncbi:hypothetical protein PV379_38245 [Streptomyces caniscabiei]|uniref:hypothetical protein n=1 Tax=Streptomyces caniscabiei TaxID=2746961 RepID=UPI0029BE488C|nr:hypothetical protein [Streptomyces caniscabiei]MDX2603001.1 hypothetical protein [Streptomyces caniscabiei]MDX2737712.1 hypothetical protein [Streptomyces caniscabiei]MDX2783104.1 hypothetical protein [Streptomyces caniscabiei]